MFVACARAGEKVSRYKRQSVRIPGLRRSVYCAAGSDAVLFALFGWFVGCIHQRMSVRGYLARYLGTQSRFSRLPWSSVDGFQQQFEFCAANFR
jgi:hypothetical protein